MKLKDYLKKDIKEKETSVRALAVELGMSHVMLYHILNGKFKAGVSSIRKIAAHYELDIREVVEMNDK